MVSAMKRSFSDSSDHEDVFDDRLKPGSPTQSCQIGMSDRKKRRGIIEKRRRDRINNSLSELRRLVPTAFEKQGSAKLEKAEILQMTVDHLKVLHQKGLNGYNYPDPHTLAMDYRSVGFRECAAEVARYLVAVEGMDIQDPLRLRLMSHIQCFSAQRDLAAKANMQNNSWNNTQYNSNSGSMISPPQHNQEPQLTSSMTTHHSALPTVPSVSYSDSRFSQHSDMSSNFSHVRLPPTGSVAPSLPNSCTPVTHAQVTSSLVPTLPQVHTQFPMSLNMNSLPMLSPNTHNGYSPTNTTVKPYRPWGAELAY